MRTRRRPRAAPGGGSSGSPPGPPPGWPCSPPGSAPVSCSASPAGSTPSACPGSGTGPPPRRPTVELTFNAFQSLTDAVNGVTVCVPPPGINDPNYSGLVLSAGHHVVKGAQALEFVRDRHGVGDALTSNLTVDSTLDPLPAMVSLAESVKGLKTHYIQMITAPDGPSADPSPSISAESRSGDQDICSDLPTPNAYGGSPDGQ
ncbi:LCP family protein [Streptacidiphilus sp. P02-A3a]|uniref:LCP family protein n=1 Tax=Streptacidiphilus sp. P02-A3a TaxID=2704468 RepID=UPI0015F7A8E5|nr:LCP family protein [Streptacidiphilus sp. P02-A3a]QMU73847.1 hypothetical protein GXP74_15815 [Streptacidiphilus sp. P02-A3a]